MSYIERLATEDCPEIKLNWDTYTLEIKGNSYPENSDKIYEPIKAFLDNYNIKQHKQLHLVLFFNLINSTSTVYVAQLVNRIAKMHKKGLEVSVKWYYNVDDEELLDLGHKLVEISKLPIEYIPVAD